MSAAMMREKIEEIEKGMEVMKNHMHQVAARPVVTAIATVADEIINLIPEEETKPPVPEPELQRSQRKRPGAAEEQVLQVLENELNILESNVNQIHRYAVEIHKKYSIPFSCIIFVLLGAPLAMRSGRKGMTMSIGFSILFFLIYYVFLISGEKLADRRFVSPWLAMWLPNIILGTGAVILIHRTVLETQVINWNRINPLKRWRRKG